MRAKVTAPRSGLARPERTTVTVLAAVAVVVLAATATCSANDEQGAAPTALSADELPHLAAQFADAVWRVETDGCGWLGTGSAFAIDSRHLVTNYHVIANDSSPKLRSRAGETVAGRVIGALERPDIAVIEVDQDLTTLVGWAPTDALVEAEPIVIMGYPIPDRAFAMTTGEIVTFQPPDDREALLSNAPIDRGNSGGPALRRDGSVAGVVTLMTTDAASGGVISVAFTAKTAQSTVEGFIREPNQNVQSHCGHGPDYIPPAPADFVIPPPEAIPPVPSQPAETSSTTTSLTASTSTGVAPTSPSSPKVTVACPGGDVAIDIGGTAAAALPDDPGWWEVQVTGEVHNNSPADIQIGQIDVTVEGDPPGDTLGFADVGMLASDQSTAWSAGQFVYSPDYVPSATTAVLDWRWAAPELGSCESEPVEIQGP